MNKKIQSALISVFYKDGLEPIVKLLSELGVLFIPPAEHKVLLKNWE
jgi:hypothetical protein